MPAATELWAAWPGFFGNVHKVTVIVVAYKPRAYSQIVALQEEVIGNIVDMPTLGIAERGPKRAKTLASLSLTAPDFELAEYLTRELKFYDRATSDFLERCAIAGADGTDDAAAKQADSEGRELLGGAKTIKESIEHLIKRFRPYGLALPYKRIENWFSVLNEILSIVRGGG